MRVPNRTMTKVLVSVLNNLRPPLKSRNEIFLVTTTLDTTKFTLYETNINIAHSLPITELNLHLFPLYSTLIKTSGMLSVVLT